MTDDLPTTDDTAQGLALFLRLRSRPLRAAEVYEPLAESMNIPGRLLLLKRHTRNESRWHNRVQSARASLVKQGFMTAPPPDDAWSLTTEGRAWAEKLEWLKTTTSADLGL